MSAQHKSAPASLKRKLLQDKGDQLRKERGLSYAVDQILEVLHRNHDEGHNVAVDSMRNHFEVYKLRQEFQDFFLIALHADKQIRWERCKSQYAGNWDHFCIDDDRDSGEKDRIIKQLKHGQHVKECVYLADVFISNNEQCKYQKDWDALFNKIDGYLDLLNSPGSQPPSKEETFMAQAYLVSLQSSCTKRKVGAIITLPDGTGIVSSGFNEAPRGEKKCIDLGGKEYCFILDKCREKLSEMKYCPNCGYALNIDPKKVDIPYECPKCSTGLPHQYVPGKMLDLCLALHAEEDAIIQAAKHGGTALKDCTLYTTTFPCTLCAKKIVDVGIKTVVYMEPYPMLEYYHIFQEGQSQVATNKFEGVAARSFCRLFKKLLN
jgi:deoxycytidylate deaminase